MQYFMYLLKSPCPHPCLCEALQNFHVCAFAYLYAVVCVCLSFRATKNETNEAQKTFQLSPQLTFDCSPGLRLLFLPDPHLLAPHFAPHTLPPPLPSTLLLIILPSQPFRSICLELNRFQSDTFFDPWKRAIAWVHSKKLSRLKQ